MLLMALAVTACAKDPEHVVAGTAPATIEPDPAKATLIIHSNTNLHFIKTAWGYFVDNQFVGQDRSNGYQIVKVEPGIRWVFFTIKEKIYNTGKFKLEAGKRYYILRKAVPGGAIMTTQTPEQFAQYLKETSTEFLEFKPVKDDVPELDADDIKDEQEEFEEEAKDDPAKHADVLNYTGF
jgi:hypothetical protein